MERASTLLKLIVIADQTSGSLEIAGEVYALTLGVGLQEELTGRENLYLEAVHTTKPARDRSNNRRYDYICGFKRIQTNP